MSDFTVYFPAKNYTEVPATFATLEKLCQTHLDTKDVQTQLIGGATLLVAQSLHKKLQFYIKKNNSAWIIVKGVIFDTQGSNAHVNPELLLDCFLEENINELNRYEGSFALAAWDMTRKKGWVLNDQASVMNLYYGEYQDGLYVSTNALTLARALNLSLDPYSVQEFLARGILLTPASMFTGLKRLNIGECLCYGDGILTVRRHWSSYADPVEYRNTSEAASVVTETIVDRMSRYTFFNSQYSVCDLTGGLDSRLLVAALMVSHEKFGLTVNGSNDVIDVQIAKQIADKIQHSLNHFDTTLLFDKEVTATIRQELTYRTGGEIPFNEIYPHAFTRPRLAEEFDLHINGSGGELFRYFPWSQEFFGIGRRKLANITNVLEYHCFDKDEKTLYPNLFFTDWLPSYRNRLYHQTETICLEQPNTLTTQQLDANYVWRMTAHSSLYLSSVYNWLPTVAPLLTAGVIKLAVSLPWQMRLTTQLQRQMIYQLSPVIAGIVTPYGGTAEPTMLRNLHMEIRQTLKQTGQLVNKLEHVLLRGMISKHLETPQLSIKQRIPFLTPEFREFLHPDKMLSRGMYQKEGLQNLLGGDNEAWRAQTPLILKLATVEQLCRELQFEPDATFLNVS